MRRSAPRSSSISMVSSVRHRTLNRRPRAAALGSVNSTEMPSILTSNKATPCLAAFTTRVRELPDLSNHSAAFLNSRVQLSSKGCFYFAASLSVVPRDFIESSRFVTATPTFWSNFLFTSNGVLTVHSTKWVFGSKMDTLRNVE